MQRLILITACCLFANNLFAAASLEELQSQLEQSRFAAAQETGEQLLMQNPQYVDVIFLTAYAYQMGGQLDRAAPLYQRIIEISPDLPEPRNNLAMIYLAQGDYDRASQLLVDAINTHPSYATAYENLSRIYKGIASEAYRRAVSESSEASKYSHDIDLTAITALPPSTAQQLAAPVESETTLVNLANLETLLIEKIRQWAEAWSTKDFPAYASHYSDQHHPNFNSHGAWLDNRRKRIMRAGEIKIEVSEIQFRYQSDSTAIVDFKQAFTSPSFSDQVAKRLSFKHIGSEWKISDERVLSVI